MIVLKFGGSTLGTTERIRHCLGLIRAALPRRPVVVVSASGRTTDGLLQAARQAREGRIEDSALRAYHLRLCEDLVVPAGLVEPLLSKLESLLRGVCLLKELTPRTLDHVLSFGERLSSCIVASALTSTGVRAVPVDAYDLGLVTDENFGNARPLPGCQENIQRAIQTIQEVPVITGFIGKSSEGDITTLGRSGSDYTATFLAGAVGAEEVLIYKDVDGVMTADPSLDDRARNIPQMSFEEAAELAYFGAEVLHPATLLPAIKANVPVRVINAFRPNDSGTVICDRPVLTGRLAKSIVYKEDVSLFHLRSPRLLSVPEVLTGALATLAGLGVVAQMISTSEAGISLISQSGLSDSRRRQACQQLEAIAPAQCEPGMAIICVVGEELRGKGEAVGRVFSALAACGLNPRVITRSASEINLAFLVPERDVGKAVRALHPLILEE